MRIGLIDVDNYEKLDSCFPNLCLMKISAWHKFQGDYVEWYDPLLGGVYDKVYCSKVFSFTEDYPYPINAKEIQYGGSGYCISLVDGKEVFDKSKDIELPYEIEHIMPDYSLYWNDLVDFDENGKLTKIGIKHRETAYGYASRGCPRGCSFCHVKTKEGLKSHEVADISEFWNGQKNISLFDPNTLACKEWKHIIQQLIDTKAYVDFNQGVDIRLMTKEKADMIRQVKVKTIHFAFDRYQDKDIVMPRLKTFAEETNWGHKVEVYVLCNFDTTMEQNLERIYFIRSLNFCPYVMLYDKEHIPRGHELKKLQRWVNNKILFWRYETFEDYLANECKTH